MALQPKSCCATLTATSRRCKEYSQTVAMNEALLGYRVPRIRDNHSMSLSRPVSFAPCHRRCRCDILSLKRGTFAPSSFLVSQWGVHSPVISHVAGKRAQSVGVNIPHVSVELMTRRLMSIHRSTSLAHDQHSHLRDLGSSMRSHQGEESESRSWY